MILVFIPLKLWAHRLAGPLMWPPGSELCEYMGWRKVNALHQSEISQRNRTTRGFIH